MSGADVVPVVVCLAQLAQQACDTAAEHKKECQRIGGRLTFLLSLLGEWLESSDKEASRSLLNALMHLETSLKHLNEILYDENKGAPTKPPSLLKRFKRFVTSSSSLRDLKKAEEDLNSALSDFQVAQMCNFSDRLQTLSNKNMTSGSQVMMNPSAVAAAAVSSTSLPGPPSSPATASSAQEAEPSVLVEKADSWRMEGLKAVRGLDILEDFALECETGYVKFGLNQLVKSQKGHADLTAWAKAWAIDLLQDQDSNEYARANMLDAYRKVCLELLYCLCNFCQKHKVENPTEVFKPRFAEGILMCVLPMDRAKCLYWNNNGGMHWYSKDDELVGGWMHLNDNATGNHTINKRYQWILDHLIQETSSKRAQFLEILQPQKCNR